MFAVVVGRDKTGFQRCSLPVALGGLQSYARELEGGRQSSWAELAREFLELPFPLETVQAELRKALPLAQREENRWDYDPYA